MTVLDAKYPNSSTRNKSSSVLGLAVGLAVAWITGREKLGVGVGLLTGLVAFVSAETQAETAFSEAVTYSQSVVGHDCNSTGHGSSPTSDSGLSVCQTGETSMAGLWLRSRMLL